MYGVAQNRPCEVGLKALHLTKSSLEISVWSLKELSIKDRRSAKNALMNIIMLVNPSQHSFSEKIIFDFQITIPRL